VIRVTSQLVRSRTRASRASRLLPGLLATLAACALALLPSQVPLRAWTVPNEARTASSTTSSATSTAIATLPSALNAIQAAFLSNDASRLSRFFPRRSPVYVSVPPLETGTFLAPGPLKAFLDRLVRERLSVAFELPVHVPDVAEGQTASTFVKVKWTHRPPASATLQVDYLHLALRYAAEDAEWQIVEIKTSLR
jgi:hypothetical protein